MSHIGRPTLFFSGLLCVLPVLIAFTWQQSSHWMYKTDPRPWSVSSTMFVKFNFALHSLQPSVNWCTKNPISTILLPSLQPAESLSFSPLFPGVFDFFSYSVKETLFRLLLVEMNLPLRFLFLSIALGKITSSVCRKRKSQCCESKLKLSRASLVPRGKSRNAQKLCAVTIVGTVLKWNPA